MNIAVFHDLPSGGAKRALLEQVRGLRRLGHRVDAFVPATANEEFLPLAAVASSVRSYALPAPPDRARMLEGRPQLLDPFRWVRHLIRVRRVATQIARDIDAGSYDVALVHPSQFTQAPWVLQRIRTPCLYYCQEPLRAAYEPRIATPLVRLLIQQTLGRIDRRNLRAASAVAVNSAFTAANVQRIYDRVARVIYLGVDAGRFQPTSTPRGDYILTVGGVHPLKGLAFLIEALLSDADGTEAVARRTAMLVRERWSWDRSVGVLEQLCAETAACAVVHHGGNGGSTHAG